MQKERKCKTCGESFTPKSNRQHYCEPCGKEHRKAKQREYNKTHYSRFHGGETND